MLCAVLCNPVFVGRREIGLTKFVRGRCESKLVLYDFSRRQSDEIPLAGVVCAWSGGGQARVRADQCVRGPEREQVNRWAGQQRHDQCAGRTDDRRERATGAEGAPEILRRPAWRFLRRKQAAGWTCGRAEGGAADQEV